MFDQLHAQEYFVANLTHLIIARLVYDFTYIFKSNNAYVVNLLE